MVFHILNIAFDTLLSNFIFRNFYLFWNSLSRFPLGCPFNLLGRIFHVDTFTWDCSSISLWLFHTLGRGSMRGRMSSMTWTIKDWFVGRGYPPHSITCLDKKTQICKTLMRRFLYSLCHWCQHCRGENKVQFTLKVSYYPPSQCLCELSRVVGCNKSLHTWKIMFKPVTNKETRYP